MGMAILFVIFYHIGVVWDNPMTLPFRRGFIGVDIFLLFSSYGLCYSWKKHSGGGYYIRRIIRILPCFILLSIVVSVLYILKGNTLSLWDWICNLTSLSYYGLGGIKIDWYLSSLFLLYLISPVVIKMGRHESLTICLMLVVCCTLLLWMVDMELGIRCLVARLPIFVLGAALWHSRGAHFEKTWKWICAFSLVLWIVGLLFRIDRFVMSSLFTPTLLCVLIVLYRLMNRNKEFWTTVERTIELFGKYSLENYVGNCITLAILLQFLASYNCNILIVPLYFASTVIFTYICILYNGFVQRIINKFYA